MNNNFIKFSLCQLLCLGGGMLSGLADSDSMTAWYPFIEKSSLTPPGYVFGIVWTILYILMGASLFLVWRSKVVIKKWAYLFFFVQLFFNFLWTYLFFGLKNPLLGLLDIILIIIGIIGCMISFRPLSKLASLFFIPYLAWTLFALYLNFYIWQHSWKTISTKSSTCSIYSPQKMNCSSLDYKIFTP